MMREERPVAWHPQRMPAATLGAGAGITPVDGAENTVLDTARNIYIKKIIVRQTNDELAGKTLTVRAYLDGVTLVRSTAVNNNSVKNVEID